MLEKLQPYLKITRFDKPIGSLLLLWPTYWALWLTDHATIQLFVIFTLGIFLMRSAGCVINDLADHKFDGKVKRTAQRPLVTQQLSRKQAWFIFITLVICAAILLLFLPLSAFYFACLALLTTCIYPFMKRVTHLPQLILGIAFSFGILMAYASTINAYPLTCWLLFGLNICWTISYDTMYAMIDRDDDLQIGVKSTAILFGKFDKSIIALLQVITLFLLIAVGWIENLNYPFYIALMLIFILFIYQQNLIAVRDRTHCSKAFLNNNYVGAIVFLGFITSHF